MNIVTKGSGPPLVLIPGFQGRWEYMRSAVEALAPSFHVVTFALCGERSSGLPFEAGRGLDNYVAQVLGVLAELNLDRAIICGVSFGGLIAVRVAATHPTRCAALVLTSTPEPTWRPCRRHSFYARVPWLFGPLFLAETPLRLREELVAAFPQRTRRWQFALEQLRTAVRAPVSLRRMGERARILSELDVAGDCARITAPTLVFTGERGLDHVTPVNGSGYLGLIAGARSAVLERTGHVGVMTHPDRFAALVREFVGAGAGAAPRHGDGLADRSVALGDRSVALADRSVAPGDRSADGGDPHAA